VHVHALRLALEVEDDAVAKGGQRHGAQVLDADVVAPFAERAHLGAEDDGLRPPRARAVADEGPRRRGNPVPLRLACGPGGRGVARLTSSARRMWAKIGPRWNWKCFRPASSSTIMLVPMMSPGMRSGVNWMREKDSSRLSASVLMSRVLPRPGTPSSSTCPPAKRPVST